MLELFDKVKLSTSWLKSSLDTDLFNCSSDGFLFSFGCGARCAELIILSSLVVLKFTSTSFSAKNSGN
jgi:hypothetical protein